MIKEYVVPVDGLELTIGVDAQVLSAHFQGEDLAVYILEPDSHPGEKAIRIEGFATGTSVPVDACFIDTCCIGWHVYHIFYWEIV